jgi:hypothetical protein
VRVTVTSHNFAPTAKLVGPAAGMAGGELTFEAQLVSDQDGDAVTLAWDFGDGQTARGPTASHVYAASGRYTVTLTASDGRDDTVLTATVTVDPYEPPPPPPSALLAAAGYASIAVIIACAAIATYLLFFARPAPGGRALGGSTSGGEEE